MPQRQAFDELRNTLWMLAIPLAISCYSFFVVCQWNIQDFQLQDSQREIEQLPDRECIQTDRPDGAICARSVDWWQPVDSSLCAGNVPCYQLAELADAEDDYLPLVVPGLVPLLLIPLVMRKINRARSALMAATDPQ